MPPNGCELRLDHQVTNNVTDRDLLSDMAKRAKEILGVDQLEALADTGYPGLLGQANPEKRSKLAWTKVSPRIFPNPEPQPAVSEVSSRKKISNTIPRKIATGVLLGNPSPSASPDLVRQDRQTTEKKRNIRYYAAPACAHCTIRHQCTSSKDGRRITRWVDEDLLDEMECRVRASPEKIKLRKRLSERPFGSIKHPWNQGYFLTKSLENVGTEMSLTVLAYNTKRAINILGVPRMIEALA